MAEQTIEPANETELNWVRDNVKLANELTVAFAGTQEGAPLTLSALDEAFAAWLKEWRARPAEERDDPNPYINAFGLAFGQALVDALDLRWAVVTDQYGTDIAVHGQPGDQLVFPTNFVAKRFERDETYFLEESFREISLVVGGLRES